MTCFRTAGLAAALALATAAPGAFAQTLFFDDFETGNTGGANSVPSGWTLVGGYVDIIGDSYFPELCLDPAREEHCIDMDGSGGAAGHIATAQSFTLIDGGAYTLSFDYTKNWFQGGADNVMNFGVGGFMSSLTYPGSEDVLPYRTITFDFTGDGSEAAIFFQHLGGDNGGIIIDNVLLVGPDPSALNTGGGAGVGAGGAGSDVPLPAGLPLALSGLAALGLLRRRG